MKYFQNIYKRLKNQHNTTYKHKFSILHGSILDSPLNIVNNFCNFIFSPHEIGRDVSFEQTFVPFTQESYSLNVLSWYGEKGKCIFFIFRYYLFLLRSVFHHLNKFKSPLRQDSLYRVWLELVQWFYRRKWKCEK